MINFQDPKTNPYLYTELAEEFYNHGHKVYVITLLEKKNGKETSYKNEYGLNVLRLRCGDMFNVNLFTKGITTVTIPYKFKKAINQYFGNIKFDLVIYPTPPITFVSTVKYIKNRDNCSSYLILRDIFPQNGVDLGIIKNKFLYWYFRNKEKQLYKISDYIGCMSEGNIDYIVKHNKIDKNKLEILYNWTKVYKQEDSGGSVSYREKYGLQRKIVAVFGGNIGAAQDLGFLLELVKLYKDRDDIIFLIIGEGTEKERIEKIIIQEKLTNVLLKKHIPSCEFDLLARECDLGLINLDRRFTIPNIPSKTLSYFKAGIPILAAIDKNTDYGKILDMANAGLWSITGDIDSYRANFEKLINDSELRKHMGDSGRRFLEENLTVEKSYDIIASHFQ